MNRLINTIYLFGLIGLLPTVTADWRADDWQWWAFCGSLWVGVFWRDIANHDAT